MQTIDIQNAVTAIVNTTTTTHITMSNIKHYLTSGPNSRRLFFKYEAYKCLKHHYFGKYTNILL